MPIDEGWLILTEDQRTELIQQEPSAVPWIRPYMGGEEFLNGIRRYCLWLVGISPATLQSLTAVSTRVEGNRTYRLTSRRQQTIALAKTPYLFGEIRQPDTAYLFVPKVSSESREYLPIGFCDPNIIASGTALVVASARQFHFGVLSSLMHCAWMRTVCGRLESRYQYSAGIVYNNFPWPQAPTPTQKARVEELAQAVLDARALYPDSTLAQLYDPLLMPAELVKTHQRLDRAVERCYRPEPFASDRERVEFLFALYEKLTAPLLPAMPRPRRPRKTAW